MAVIRSTNEDLRNYVYDKQYVIVKFHNKENCELCTELLPVFERLSDKYTDITFVVMNSEDNPIAKKLIEKNKKPFIGIYKEGLLVECSLVASEKEFITMLDRLPNIKFDL
ncbi:MAG: thioredoxin family protein [Bacteroidota bacterium]|nr:thioredoxin family protein [Bacteroidota bacterium]